MRSLTIVLKRLIPIVVLGVLSVQVPALAMDLAGGNPVWLGSHANTQWGQLNYTAAFADDDRLYAGGVATGQLSGAAFIGDGSGLSALTDSFSAADSRLFHPEKGQDIEYQGAVLSYGSPFGEVATGASRVVADRVGDRFTWYGQIKTPRLDGSLFRISRTDGVAAYAGRLSARFGATALSYHHVDAGPGTFYRQAVLSHSLPGLSILGLQFEQGRSTRYEDAGDHRVVLTFRGVFGRSGSGALHAGDTGEGQAGLQDAAMLGVAAVAIAVLASSGSSSSDAIQRYTIRDDAARQVLNDTNPTSVRENLEYGGWVYQHSDATYSTTTPIQGRVDGVNIGTPDSVPAGTLATSSYHTHGATDPRFFSETFSPMDLIQDTLWKVDGYLATPTGRFMFHDYSTGSVTQLGTVAN
jgi:hypothetical protein